MSIVLEDPPRTLAEIAKALGCKAPPEGKALVITLEDGARIEVHSTQVVLNAGGSVAYTLDLRVHGDPIAAIRSMMRNWREISVE